MINYNLGDIVFVQFSHRICQGFSQKASLSLGFGGIRMFL